MVSMLKTKVCALKPKSLFIVFNQYVFFGSESNVENVDQSHATDLSFFSS